MGKIPKVSIVVPTFNGVKFLDDAIQSALEQTFTDFELLIVDNNSTDNTEAVIAPYLSDPRVTYLRNDRNIGLAGNWNKCLDLAKGEYIKFLCADDKLHPLLLEKFVPVLDNHQNVSLVGCFKEEFGEKSKLWQIPFHHTQKGNKVILETIKNYNYLGEPTCVMFRKAAKNQVGGFRNFSWITDWEMWVRLLTIGDCYIVPERLCFTRSHSEQLTKQIWLDYVHYWEEYNLFKAISNGAYKIDLSGSEEIIKEAIKVKAAGYCQIIPKALVKLRYRKHRQALYRATRLAFSEQVFGRSFIMLYKKYTWIAAQPK